MQCWSWGFILKVSGKRVVTGSPPWPVGRMVWSGGNGGGSVGRAERECC